MSSLFLDKSYCFSNTVVSSEELNEANNWTVNVTLPKYGDSGEIIDYSVREQEVPNGYSSSVEGFTVTNTLNEAKVIVKYIDKMTNSEIISSKTKEGYVGLEYSTNPEEISGYKLVGCSGVESGTMTKDDIVVEYYYIRLGTLTINKVDKNNKTITNGTAKFQIFDENNNRLHFKKDGINYIVSENTEDLDYVETVNGQVLIKEITVGNYKIQEIKAPDGYFLLNSKKDVKITNDKYEIKIDIINKKEFSLPITGGKSMIFIMISSILLISLGFFIIILKKIKKGETKI